MICWQVTALAARPAGVDQALLAARAADPAESDAIPRLVGFTTRVNPTGKGAPETARLCYLRGIKPD